MSQPEIRDYSWPLFEFVLSLRRTFQELHCVTSLIRDHISKGTAPLAHSQTTDLLPGAADYLQALNDFRTGLLDKVERIHRSNSFLRNWRDTPSFSSLVLHVTIRCSVLVIFFPELHKFTLMSSYTSLQFSLHPPPPLPPLQCPASTGATAGSSGVPQQRGMRRNNNRTFLQNETMNEPHTKHRIL